MSACLRPRWGLGLLALLLGTLAWAERADEAQLAPARFLEPAAVARHFLPPPDWPDTPGLSQPLARPSTEAELEQRQRALLEGGRIVPDELGRSADGRPLTAWRFSRGPGRPAVLLLGQQHGDEPAGAEALIALAARLADDQDPLAVVLERIDVVMLPRVNPDGSVAGRRTNAADHDVNRDHLGPATAEARAVARLARRVDPIVVADLHEYRALPPTWVAQGYAARHDLLLQPATTAGLDPALGEAADRWFVQPIWRRASAAGLSVDWYHQHGGDPTRLSMGGVQPQLARNALGLRHAVSLLLETRGLGLGAQHLPRRVWTHVLALETLLQGAAEHAPALVGLRQLARERAAALACGGELVLGARPQATRRRITQIEIASGREVEREVAWASALALTPSLRVAAPCGYWLHAGAGDAAARLAAMGLAVQTLTAPATLRRQDHDGGPGEGPGAGEPAAGLEAEPGDHLVRLDQPLAVLVALLLDPRSPHGLVARGLLDPRQVAPLAAMPDPP